MIPLNNSYDNLYSLVRIVLLIYKKGNIYKRGTYIYVKVQIV